ncbi:biotin carboxylase N-terminal domain-containing protein [Plantibacter sp. ME-Dv--P-095]|uniref:acetyl/propionyl/methylcrotonyl-CoA carboxylase subunit alpha n=1 Tax=Plantibacter sp. ME-Dv--P-095 TaxID=3040299 RepID=UPI002551C823|nr:biotin carboxylase N-terminal domain-containing protein [Plantibacter sp. ME-Dv--P-095]
MTETSNRPGTLLERPFRTVLVANRGEIACRVIRSLRAMGVESVAVYSDADRDAPHVRLADRAVRIGPAVASESYLDVAAVVGAALATGAEAVHPGYGFLSEQPALARALAAAGIVFIGPDERALELMGDKIRAKDHVAARGVPIIEGVADPSLDDDALAAAGIAIGFPLIVKPAGGGGGKGMQVVERAEELSAAIASAHRVAQAAFGDPTLLLERFVTRPRHIEVQVLADAHGTVLHLGERECSLQRRHQKVVEESPSPRIDAGQRARLGEAACTVARSVGYRGVGTVEFLVADDRPDEFAFLEMNTRLQVEHPVTELVTGLDLVEWQVRVAAGQPLELTQDDIVLTGHAVEARLYAEDPASGFLPQTGVLERVHLPSGPGVRVDGGIAEGQFVGPWYDPMLAKIVCWAPDRESALRRLDAALAATIVFGVRTNLGFLRRLVTDTEVVEGRLHTGLIAELLAESPVTAPDDRALAAAALAELDDRAVALADRAGTLGTPWSDAGGWRLSGAAPSRVHLRTDDGRRVRVDVLGPSDDARVTVAEAEPVHAAVLAQTDRAWRFEHGGTSVPFETMRIGDERWTALDGVIGVVAVVPRDAVPSAGAASAPGAVEPDVRTPMPGTVTAVHVTSGDDVAVGQSLVTVEAMKMEHLLTAPAAGVVTVHVTTGGTVATRQSVATIAADPVAAPTNGAPV